MGYAHIPNLYKEQTILLFRECWALEKIHGTSAHISWKDGRLTFFSGGEKHERFVGIFDPALADKFAALGHSHVTVYGEAYGGSQQKQAWRYGPQLKFAAFDVDVGGVWLNIPDAADVVAKLGLEFVHYEKCSTDLAALDAQRDAPSTQAKRNGVEGDKRREGVVLRPLIEIQFKNGDRICAKHKRDEERETATPRKVVDPTQQAVLTAASSIALEWVTETRLAHVLDKLPPSINIEGTRDVIAAMIEDVVREGAGEFVDTREARQAIGKRAADLFRAHLKNGLRQ